MKSLSLFILILVVFALDTYSQTYVQIEKITLNDEEIADLEANSQFKGIEISSVIVLPDDNLFFVGWIKWQNIAGIFRHNNSQKEIIYQDDFLDETHLIRSSLYFDKSGCEGIISTKYGYPEFTVGTKFFHYSHDSLKYLGEINFLKLYNIDELGMNFNAPYNELTINKRDDIISIKYPPGEYALDDEATSGVIYENGIIFNYRNSQFEMKE